MRRRAPAPVPAAEGDLPAELAVGHPRWAGPQGWHEWRRAVDDWCEASGVGSEQLPERVRYWRSSLGRCHVRALRGEATGPA